MVATQTLARQLGTGVFFDSLERLGELLGDRNTLGAVGAGVWQERARFTFDHHAPALLRFFRRVIDHAAGA